MFKFDVIATILLFMAFFIEFALILSHKPEKKLIKDMKANFIIGVCLILVGLFIKTVEFSLFSILYYIAPFKPVMTVWLWMAGFLCCDFIQKISVPSYFRNMDLLYASSAVK